MKLNKPIRFSISSDNPDFYNENGIMYGLYKGYSPKTNSYITFKIHSQYWSGTHDSYSGMYDTEVIISTEPELDRLIVLNYSSDILPIEDCHIIH
jgi:hypothetical protein